MNKRWVFILFSFVILLSFLFIGFPIEFFTASARMNGMIIFSVFFLLLFAFLFFQIKRLSHRIFKIITFSLFLPIAVLYMFIAFWEFSIPDQYGRGVWNDLFIYTNDRNEKVISQWREISGSIHDQRTRKIVREYESFRISYNYNEKKLKQYFAKIFKLQSFHSLIIV